MKRSTRAREGEKKEETEVFFFLDLLGSKAILDVHALTQMCMPQLCLCPIGVKRTQRRSQVKKKKKGVRPLAPRLRMRETKRKAQEKNAEELIAPTP